jgi:hypothetical protein
MLEPRDGAKSDEREQDPIDDQATGAPRLAISDLATAITIPQACAP